MAETLQPGQSQGWVWLPCPGDKVAHPPFELDGMVLGNIADTVIEKRILEALKGRCHIAGCSFAHGAGGKPRNDLVIVKAEQALFYVPVSEDLAHSFTRPVLLGLPNLRQIGVAKIQDVKLETEEWIKIVGV